MFRFHTDPNGQGGQRKSLAFLWMVWTFTNKDFHTSAVYHSMTHENHLQHGLFWSNIDLSHNELQVHLFCRHFRVVSQSPHRLGRVVYISYTKPARCLARNLQPRTFGEVGARGTRCGGLMFGRNLWSEFAFDKKTHFKVWWNTWKPSLHYTRKSLNIAGFSQEILNNWPY